MDVQQEGSVAGKAEAGLEPVGMVTRYFSQLTVAGVALKDGCTVQRGDVLRFERPHHRTCAVTVQSMEHDHRPIANATGPLAVGILVGQRVTEGRPVFRSKTILPAE